MSGTISGNRLLVFLLFVSLFGLVVGSVSAFYPAEAPETFPLRKPLVGSIFVLLSAAGIAAVFSPNRCSRLVSLKVRKGAENRESGELPKNRPGYLGHHPHCGNFAPHVFKVGGRTLCAGCTGLFVGGLLGLTGSLAYFFVGLEPGNASGGLVAAGFMAIVFALLLPAMIKIPFGSIRLLANAALPVGSCLLLVGVDSLAQSTSLDIFLVVLIFFWLYARISISQLGHSQVCRLCKNTSCESRGF